MQSSKLGHPLRILCISRAYGQHAGGMERLSFELIESLSRETDVEVESIVNHTATHKSLFFNRVRSVLFVVGVLPRSLKAARSVDVVHLGDPVLSFAGWLIQLFYKKPVVVTVHGLDVSYEHFLYTLYLKLFFRKFNGYIAISDYAQKKLGRYNIEGKIRVIPPGIGDVWYDPSYTRDQLAALLKRNTDNKTVLLTTGRLVRRKGHEWFIRSVLPRLGDDVLYVIAGQGPEAAAIASAVKELSLEHKVVQLGRVSSQTLKLLYNTTDAFIQPNIVVPGDAEGFGIVLSEAASCGLRVFAANVEGIPQAIHEGKNGYLLAPENNEAWITALDALLRQERTQLGAREYTLQQFSWDTVTSNYRSFFVALASGEK